MDGETAIDIRILSSLSQIAAADWDACACPEAADGGPPADPFTTHRFLSALEQSGSVGPGSGEPGRPRTEETAGCRAGSPFRLPFRFPRRIAAGTATRIVGRNVGQTDDVDGAASSRLAVRSSSREPKTCRPHSASESKTE